MNPKANRARATAIHISYHFNFMAIQTWRNYFKKQPKADDHVNPSM